MAEHLEVMNELKYKLNEILDDIPRGSNVVYLDYPFHLNVGDILIYKGTERFFKDNEINVKFRVSVDNFDIEYLCENFSDCIFVCHGGGNFGDIYDAHQSLRLEVIKHFRGKVVILPQSIHYNSQNKLDSDKIIFSSHKNLVFFARDQASLDICSLFSSKHKLMPDMAHYLWSSDNVVKNIDGKINTLFFLRKDCEKSDCDTQYASANSIDWEDIFSYFDIKLYEGIKKLSRIKFGYRYISTITAFFWWQYTEYIISKVTKYFNNYDAVITSRLHGHIFSCLLCKPNKVLDNFYGKCNRYMSLWTGKSDIVSKK